MPTVTDALGNTTYQAPRILSDNLLHNSDGRISQRPSPSTTADGAYGGPDRWYSLTQTASITSTQASGGYANRITQPQVTPQRMGRAQIIELYNANPLFSQSGVLSGRARTSSGQTIRYAILEWVGAIDVVSKDVINDWTSTDYSDGPSKFFVDTNINVIAVGSITPAADQYEDLELVGTFGASLINIIIVIWTQDVAAQNVYLDFVLKFEKGTQATEYIIPEYSLEMLRCMRYFTALGSDRVQATGSTNSFGFSVNLPVPMRVSPTIVPGVYVTQNITGTPTTSITGGINSTLDYAGVVTTNGLMTQIKCTGTTLSADM